MCLFFLATLDLTLAVLVAAIELVAQTIIALKACSRKAAGKLSAHRVSSTNQKAIQGLVAELAGLLQTSAIRADEVVIATDLVNILKALLACELETYFVGDLTFVLF